MGPGGPLAVIVEVAGGENTEKAQLSHDPAPFECPYSGCEYDCQQRAPVRMACACKRLVCRKCAGVAASQPDGCGLCGSPAGGLDAAGAPFSLDLGVLLALTAGGPSKGPQAAGER